MCKVALNVMGLFLEACMNNACMITFKNMQLQTASYVSHNYVHLYFLYKAQISCKRFTVQQQIHLCINVRKLNKTTLQELWILVSLIDCWKRLTKS